MGGEGGGGGGEGDEGQGTEMCIHLVFNVDSVI